MPDLTAPPIGGGEGSARVGPPSVTGRVRRRRLAATIAVALASALAVGGVAVMDGADGANAANEAGPVAERSASSSPFSVGWGPDRYRQVIAGIGADRPLWGDDILGQNEPMTVLAPAGEAPTAANAIVVSVTGYAGFQGGLHQAAAGYPGDTTEPMVVQGHEALYTPRDPSADPVDARSGRFDDLVVALEDDLAVRVSPPDSIATRWWASFPGCARRDRSARRRWIHQRATRSWPPPTPSSTWL